MGIEDRLRRLEGERLCEGCPYAPGRQKVQIRQMETTKIIYPDGSVDYRRDPALAPLDEDQEPPRELCGLCPYADPARRPIRTIEVIRTVRAEPGIGGGP